MSMIERVTVTMPAEMAADVKRAVADGDYASPSEVVHEALRDWRTKRERQLQTLAVLQADIGEGLDDLAAGRLEDFDTARIIECGRNLLATRSRSG